MNKTPRTREQRVLLSRARKSALANVSPLIQFVYHQVDFQRLTYRDVEKRAGLADNALSSWFRGLAEPRAGNLEAVLNVLGYRLEAVPLTKARPPVQTPELIGEEGA
jgi:hypothetical protein